MAGLLELPPESPTAMQSEGRQLVAAMLAALVLGAALVGAGVALSDRGLAGPTGPGGGPADGERVTVSASGLAEAQPDRAVVRVGVEATADDPTVARQRVAENASAMRSGLEELGLPTDAVRTVGYDVYEDRVRPETREREPATTYRARHSFAIDVDDVDRVGEVIDTAVASGATGVHGVEFTLESETRQRLRRAAIEEAMADARGQAEAIATAGEIRLTGVHAVRTGGDARRRPVARLAGGDGGGGTVVESGPVSVSATVTVTYNATG